MAVGVELMVCVRRGMPRGRRDLREDSRYRCSPGGDHPVRPAALTTGWHIGTRARVSATPDPLSPFPQGKHPRERPGCTENKVGPVQIGRSARSPRRNVLPFPGLRRSAPARDGGDRVITGDCAVRRSPPGPRNGPPTVLLAHARAYAAPGTPWVCFRKASRPPGYPVAPETKWNWFESATCAGDVRARGPVR